MIHRPPPDDADTLPNAERRRDEPDDTAPSGPATVSATPTATGTLPKTLSETALVVLRGESATRAATFGRGAAVLSAIGLLFQTRHYREGLPALQIAMTVAYVALGIGGIIVARRARDPFRFTEGTLRGFALVGLFTSCVCQLYLGVFSPAAVITSLGLSFFALGDDRLVIALCWVAGGFYVAVALLVALDVVPDVGVFPGIAVSLEARVATIAMVSGVHAMTIYQARLSRRAMVDAVERANQARRVARQREAQLQEANQDLDVVLRVGRGRPGVRAGAYELGELVGRGAMGEIYAATHVASKRPAAVKLLHAAALRDPDAVTRFLRESEIATRLRGPNLVEVYDVGSTDDGAPYIAMELLVGSDLGRVLRRRHVLSLSDTVALVRDVARGLEIAHEGGVVHRDLKPQNLFLSERPAPDPAIWKILDFGVSKLRGTTGTLTEGALVGTPAYMSPEQARSQPGDHRADLFALGSVIYRALTGRPPFAGSDMPQVLFEIVGSSPARPLELVSTLPRDVESFLAIALAKRPEDRFQTATELADAFERAAGGRLDGALRQHARALVRAAPWGRKVGASLARLARRAAPTCCGSVRTNAPHRRNAA